MISEIPREACGIFGISENPEAAKLAYLGLYALQHRGQESAGITARNKGVLKNFRQMGLVADVFTGDRLNHLPGSAAIGHVRYSTTGSSSLANAQPILINYSVGELAIAHNGNLINTHKLKGKLIDEGAIFQSDADSEIVLHMIARQGNRPIEEVLPEVCNNIKGAYSIVMLTPKKMIGLRDPLGIRPLAIGKKGDAWIFASETCAFDIIDADYFRDVEPGEIVVIEDGELKSIRFAPKREHAFCVFEFIYYARPDSVIFQRPVHRFRRKLGEKLADEHPVDADIVISVPDSSNAATLGYSQASGIPMELGLMRSHYIGRTFIEPTQAIRDFGAKIKYNPVKDILLGNRVVVVDDSIVRGTTSKKIVNMIRKGGAKEVHLRISCPPWKNPCYYGIDTPRKEELMASHATVEEMRHYTGADSLGFLSEKGLAEVMANGGNDYCQACFTGKYPLPVEADELTPLLKKGCG